MNSTNRIRRTGSTMSMLAAPARLDQRNLHTTTGLAYRPHVAASRQLFAASPVDLTTLVIAQEIRRKAQAELQREVLRDTAYQYDMPVQHERNQERNHERGGWIKPSDADE